MSREIKFRAWNIDTKEMYLPTDKASFCAEYNYLSFRISAPHEGTEYDIDFELSNLEIMQFTGVLDKLGNEIFEGDIVRSEKNGEYEVCEVKWLNDHAGFGMWWYDNPEIIGNIYENGDLIK